MYANKREADFALRLDAVLARFFRSLNFDYIRLSNPSYSPDPWDTLPNGEDFPFVKLKLEPGITTVVGGNESGKSQVLAAIEAALTGDNYDRSDFCRYSEYFSTDKVITRPEFGATFTDVNEKDATVIRKICDFPEIGKIDKVAIFRMNEAPKFRLYPQVDGKWLDPKHIKTPTALREIGVPLPFKIDADVPLPDSVPIEYLASGRARAAVSRFRLRLIWDKLTENRSWFATNQSVQNNADNITEILRPSDDVDARELATFKLAADLLISVAGLTQELFSELQAAVRTKNGYANSIVDTINAELAKALNFPHWWTQDSQFELFVSLYEYDLVFMIRDRTGRSYAFDERSDGLKYFLSYFVQYLSHTAPTDGAQELLLMDEPDRFLSASGQQDLLRIFRSFAHPDEPDRQPVQVVYVTHSPFLIDKNRYEQIRVLEKGEHDEGTRVVASVSQNHYEPLRSAFGSFVGETAFIGTCNLILEGPSDQIILAGVSNWMSRRGFPDFDRLDLNSLTLVPSGGASEVPYMVHLARGRDVEKPAVVVLLDGDKAGDEARQVIRRGGARRKPLVSDGLVLQLSDSELAEVHTDNPTGMKDIEDLAPIRLAVDAVAEYCREFVPDITLDKAALTPDTVYDASHLDKNHPGILDLLENAVQRVSSVPSFHLDKVGFARSVVAVLDNSSDSDSLETLAANFRVLLKEIGRRQRVAEREAGTERISSRIKRARERFIRNHSVSIRREHILLLIEEIDGQLDTSIEAEDIRAELRTWHREYRLDEDPREEISNPDSFINRLKSLVYAGVRNSELAT